MEGSGVMMLYLRGSGHRVYGDLGQMYSCRMGFCADENTMFKLSHLIVESFW